MKHDLHVYELVGETGEALFKRLSAEGQEIGIGEGPALDKSGTSLNHKWIAFFGYQAASGFVNSHSFGILSNQLVIPACYKDSALEHFKTSRVTLGVSYVIQCASQLALAHAWQELLKESLTPCPPPKLQVLVDAMG